MVTMCTAFWTNNELLVKNTIKNLFDGHEVEILERPASYIVKPKNEIGNKITRIIILPPNGFTANRINETSPHPETRRAKVIIKGGIRPNRQGFSILKNVVKFAYYTKRDIATNESYAYAIIDKNNPFYREEIKSSRDKFFVVKENGEGFYHNIMNVSDEWILLIMEKELKLQKEMDINSEIGHLDVDKQNIITDLIEAIKNTGDEIFHTKKELIVKTLELETNEVIPVLIEALNIHETGKHEPCTVYAIILKFAKKDPEGILKFLEHALDDDRAPKYYLEELIKKTAKVLLVENTSALVESR